MCGILGINRILKEGAFSRAASCFAYRGPDAYAESQEEGVTLGHHRLSILDLDPRSNQPMHSNDGLLSIVFNGEIYNFQELKATLAAEYEFRTTSDTEVLLAAYSRYGRELTKYLRGMYAFAIHDRTQGTLSLFRDPVGIKPVYFYQRRDLFCFASEAKGVIKLLEIQKIRPQLHEPAWDLFWTFGYVPSPLTLVDGLHKLERGQGVCFDLKTYQLERFHSVKREEEQLPIRPQTLRELSEQSVLDHLIADAPVGLFFSGGTDSSLIAAILQKHGINLKTFSLVMPGNEADRKYLTKIRATLGLQGEVVEFGSTELQTSLERIASRIDEPTSDSSIFPTYWISQAAKDSVKVVLSGEGGDELFLGYHRQLGLANIQRIKNQALASLLDRTRTLSQQSTLQRVHAKGYLAAQDAAGFYLSQMSLLREATPNTHWQLGRSLLEALDCKPYEIDQELALENDLLRKIDLATSYASLEGRVPLLDPRLIQYAKRISPQTHLQDGVFKHELKALLATYLPTELVYRPKAGFGMQASLLKTHAGFHELAQTAWAELQTIHVFPPALKRAIENRLAQGAVGAAVITLRSALRELSLDG